MGEKEFFVKEKAGKYYSADDIMEIIEKEKIFISESKGGVTFSGGEPLLQFEFLLDALKRCKSTGFHTALDTSGYAKTEQYLSLIPYTDLFLFDIKHLDGSKHLLYTGVSNELIMNNLKLVLDSGRDVMIRIPVVPGFNDDPANLESLRSFLEKNKNSNLKKINLLPYHRIGASKYKKFNIPYRMNGVEPPSPARMKELKQYFEETGIKVKIGG